MRTRRDESECDRAPIMGRTLEELNDVDKVKFIANGNSIYVMDIVVTLYPEGNAGLKEGFCFNFFDSQFAIHLIAILYSRIFSKSKFRDFITVVISR